MKKNILRSPFFYVGDKYKLIAEIGKYFPDNIAKFVEPFVGGGSVFMNVNAKEFYLNDIDENIVKLHRFLCESAKDPVFFYTKIEGFIEEYGLSYSYKKDTIPFELKSQYKKTYIAKYNKKAYEKLRADYNNSSNDELYLLYLLLIYGFNRMLRFNKKGIFNLPVGNVDFNSNVAAALDSYFNEVKIKEPIWSSLDYKVLLRTLELTELDFVYLDPPYLITHSEYNKLWNETKELELLELLDDLNARNVRFAVSNVTHYKDRTNELFIDWMSRYNVYPIKSNYISYHDNSIKVFNEVLVTNY